MSTPIPDALTAATGRLLDTVDSLADDRYAEHSLLPGWTIGHVVAHLALNADALTGALRGVREADPTPMYASDAARDGDIETLAVADPDDLRIRLSTSAAYLAEEVVRLDPRDDDTEVDRTPGGRRFLAGVVPYLRLREVEIHHADLGVGYRHADWPEETVELFLDRTAAAYDGAPFTAVADDLDRSWDFGGGPEVHGTGSALAWWTTGRSADGLRADGELPRIEGR